MRLAILAALGLAACETPNTRIAYAISDDSSQSCGSSNCADVKIPCDAVISIRILRPSDPAAPLVTICEPLPQNRNKDLCAISSVDLGDKPLELPKETLEVQMLIWPRDEVTTDGELDCAKHEVVFDAVAGFPVSQDPAPAIGGHTYYHPGDEEIRVELGCTNLPALRTCNITSTVDITSTVESLENLGVLVSVDQGSRLSVDIGEPKLRGADTVYSLTSADTQRLTLEITDFGPVWRATLEPQFIDIACVQVLEDAAQATATVKCVDDNIPPITDALTLRAVHIPKPTLDQILAALSLAQFPANGLVIGIVVDPLFNPLAGQVVTTTNGTVQYLSADRTSVGGAATSANGIFLSQNAPFGTRFSVAGSNEEVGGQIQGKVTVVVIQK
ncbi:MAG: hypothetical protein H6Q90_6882 [Deltaproteobacteria bacterium]|nr:hypothetical protein [Deltaproteobacteria bacterium]